MARNTHKKATGGPAHEVGSEVVRRGGKVDPDALRRRILEHAATEGADQAPAGPASSPAPETTGIPDDDSPIAVPVGVDDDAPNRVVFDLQRDLNKRLDKYLTDRIPFMSRSQLQRLIDEGGVKVNGRAPKASTTLRRGDRVEVFVPPPPSSEVAAEDIPLDVLYEDEYLVVLNKQADIIVHPARSHNKGTMINALAYHFQHRSAAGGGLSGVGKEFARPGVVHRLDRNTTGVIVFAKNDEVHWKLGVQFEHRRVEKRYVAIVHGLVEPPIDVIEFPIGPHPSKEKGYREKYVVRHDALGKPSVTICRVMAHLSRRSGEGTDQADASVTPKSAASERFSIVELDLKTGRTHQIRVHLSHLGYPIVGDDMYGGKAVEMPAMGGRDDEAGSTFARQALHAAMLRFQHPASGETMTFTAPLPADLRRLVRTVCEQSEPTRFEPPGLTLSMDRLLGEPAGTRTDGSRQDGEAAPTE